MGEHPLAAVGADPDCRQGKGIVCPPFPGPRVRMATLGERHDPLSLAQRFQASPPGIDGGGGTRAGLPVQVDAALGTQPPTFVVAQSLRRQCEQNIFPHKPFHVDPRAVEKVHIEFLVAQLVLLPHLRPERTTILYLKPLTDREGKQLETPTAMELKVRGDLAPYKDPG